MDIELSDRLHKQLVDFCKINNLDLKSYILDKIEKGFSIDRFGDLNVLSGNYKEEVTKKEKEEKIQIKSATYIKKNDEILLTFTNEQKIHLDMKTVDGLIDLIPPQVIMVEKNTEEAKPDKEEEKPKITTRRRQIKSK